MRYRIFRHPDVARDLIEIADLVAEFAGARVARRKLGEIEKTVRGLAETPHIGTLRDDIQPGVRAIPTARKGVICFEVDDARSAVYVISITYAGADWIGRLPSRSSDTN